MSLEKLKEMLNNDLPDCLYHYTSRDSFIGIMKNKEFWASHIRFMNDLEEEKLAEKKLLDSLSMSSKLPSMDIKKLKEEVIFAIKKEMLKKAIFLVSLSEEPDELNMWRGYGKNAPAYCIQIDCNKLIRQFIAQPAKNKCIRNPELFRIADILNKETQIDESIFAPSENKRKIYYSKCIYDENTQQKLIEEIINDSIDRLDYLETSITEKSLSEEIAKRFIFYAPIIKDSHFEHESEWRIVIILENSFTPVDSKKELEEELENQTCNYLKDNIKKEIEQFDRNLKSFLVNMNLIDFRMGDSFIIPYHKFKFNTDCITKVIIGACPDKDSVEESTIYFLQQVGFKNADSIVVSSEIPFRSW